MSHLNFSPRYCRSMLRLIENSDSDQLQDLLYEKVGELFSSTQSDDQVTAYRDVIQRPGPTS